MVPRPLIALATAACAVLVLGVLLSAASLAGGAPSASVNPTVQVYLTSADLGQALTRMPDLAFSAVAPSVPVISVNEGVRYQTIKGVGGAMTDTSAWLIDDKLGVAARRRLMDALFGTRGIRLGFLHVPMGASDFTAKRTPYSYDDLRPGRSDPTLAHFSIAHDTSYILPTVEQALALNPSMFVLASPWSPPGWMKTNNQLGNRADRGRLKVSADRALAAYFVKFLRAYARAGVRVDAVTPQNEPGQGTIYPGMNMSEAGEAAFVMHDLAPALKRARLHTTIYGYDGIWGARHIPFGFSLAAGPATGTLAGMSTHCYSGDPAVISTLHGEAPGLDEIVSECSPGIQPAPTSEIEIAAMRNWASAVASWNLALDPSGGPVQPPNDGCRGCTGIVTIDPATQTFKPTRDYFQLGQISKFVRPGAVRIDSNTFVTYAFPVRGGGISTPGVDDVAFENPDGSRVLVAYNSSSAPATFAVQDDGGSFSYTLPSGATATFVWDQPTG